MKSRLAFSIASFVNPDILILDVVLPVGDGAFKKERRKNKVDNNRRSNHNFVIAFDTPGAFDVQ